MNEKRPVNRPKKTIVNGRCYLCGNEMEKEKEHCTKCYPPMNIRFEFPQRQIYAR